ncbi:hypothetical protein JCGZ_15941 [Jatropha curcas]|uniref:Expansin n=1 Tax=Jatropha curcas TaxID=180498 RepID=A0A067LBP7_JATCU|nr:putative expansin-A17 [Jatropha curcas]KDP41534.1 hypothetical protein JCGZ_15941 [Jatropha curcas]
MVMPFIFMLLGFFSTKPNVEAALSWQHAHATFYGPGTGGACGYANLNTDGYGFKNTALSTALFKNGAACGGCYEITCDSAKDPQWCIKGRYITVTATNFCPPNSSLPNDKGGWCNPPLQHFDMSTPAFEAIAHYKAGIVPVHYRKIPCTRSGGLRFTVTGKSNFELVLISNVGGTGEISQVWMKASGSNKWESLTRNWGANWQSLSNLHGQSLSFAVHAIDGRSVTALDVIPANWAFGQSFKSKVNF